METLDEVYSKAIGDALLKVTERNACFFALEKEINAEIDPPASWNEILKRPNGVNESLKAKIRRCLSYRD